MRSARGWLVAFVLLSCAGTQHLLRAAEPASVDRLLFSGTDDLFDVWGKPRIVVSPISVLKEMESPGFSFVAAFLLPDGRWDVFGHTMNEQVKGDEPYDRVATWALVRATTRDGVTFEDRRTVHEQPAGAWTDHYALARNGQTGEYLLLKLRIDRRGIGYYPFFSSDGNSWTQHSDRPLFYDGDAMSLFYSPVLQRFVCINKSLQPWPKRLRDHGGTTPALNDDSLRDRRVLMTRTSVDGRTWEPNISMNDVWNRHNEKSSIPPGYFMMPDADDPPDLEFYSGNAFWYRDRAYMLVLNYCASRTLPLKHGRQLDNEWWTSRDGLRWERPARGMNALEAFPRINRLESGPLMAADQIIFRHGPLVQGLPADRISGVSSRTNAEFSTRLFTMPDRELSLNAAIPSTDRSFATDQAYVFVSIVDDQGQVIPGFEAERCLLEKQDGVRLPLVWKDQSSRTLAGKKIRLRFHFRSATIYAVNL